MAELTRYEFASLCNTTHPIITTNIKRGKLVELNKKLDTDNALNAAFIQRYHKKNLNEKTKKIEQVYNEVVDTTPDAAEKKESNNKSQRIVDWDLKKKKADALLQERKAEKELLNLEKLAGKLIPLDLTYKIINAHNHEIFATFHNDLENIASIYCDILAGGDRKKLSEINTKLGQRLEEIIARAKDMAESSVEIAVDEYSETRSRGERR